MLYDISPHRRRHAGVARRHRVRRSASTSIADGATVNLTSITTTPHLGAHADAPLHSERDGASIADVALEAYLGLQRMRVRPSRSSNRII